MNDSYTQLILGIFGTMLFGVAVLGASRLLSPPTRSGGEGIMDVILETIGWTLIWCSLLTLAFSIFVGLPIIALIAGIVVYIRRTRARKYALLSTLGVAAKRMMPLVPVVEAFADEQRGRLAWQARLLASRLKSGWLLPDALDASGSLISREARATIRTGFESGVLAAALRNAAGDNEPRDTVWAELSGKLAYLICLVMAANFLITFMMWKIAPAFEKIFIDFETPLPAVTQFAMTISNIFVRYWFILFFPFWIFAAYGALRYLGLIQWNLPGMTQLARRFHTATILDALAPLAWQDRPLVEGLAILGRTYPKRLIRKRLNRVLADVQAGADWCDSMARHGLIGRADRAVLQAAARVGNLPWAMTEMADSNRRRLAYRCQVWLQIAYAVVILTLGIGVLFFCFSYFCPLVSLIRAMA